MSVLESSSKGVSLQGTISAETSTVTVEYSVEHSCGDEDTKKAPVSVAIPAGGSALQVMEAAANKYGSQYYFTAKYYGDSVQGFDVETINGIPSNPTSTSQCHWDFLIRLPDGSVKLSKLGVSSYYFDTDGYGMIMRFTKTPQPKMVKVDYCVDYQENPGTSETVPVWIPAGGSALQVMQGAANKCGSQYYFTSKYYGGSLHGFMVETINGVPGDHDRLEKCYWDFLIKPPNGTAAPSSVGISSYHFETDGYGMIMRLTKE